MKTGSTVTIDSNVIKWVTLTDPSTEFIYCEGTNVFSDQGYCLNKEKFVKFGTQ